MKVYSASAMMLRTMDPAIQVSWNVSLLEALFFG